MNIILKIAIRYIFSKRTYNFINIVTFFAAAGIAVGVAALICILSIFNGFQDLTKEHLVGFDPHIRIGAKDGAFFKPDDSLFAALDSSKYVSRYMTIVSGRVIATKGENIRVATLMGVEVGASHGAEKHIILGKYDLSEDSGLPGFVCGGGVSDDLGALTGEIVELYSPKMIERSLLTMRVGGGLKTTLNGVFAANIKNYDSEIAFVSAPVARDLFNIPSGAATSIDVKLRDIESLDYALAELKAAASAKYKFSTWIDLNRDLYEIMQFERASTFVILSLIILIAAFNLLASLSMTVVEKRKDIAVLTALGLSKKSIASIFMIEGFIIGVIGSLIGALLGVFLSLGQERYGWIKIDGAKYIVDSLPVKFIGFGVIEIIFVALALSLAASIFPAYKSLKYDPAESLRTE